jgi:hypothetical protein
MAEDANGSEKTLNRIELHREAQIKSREQLCCSVSRKVYSATYLTPYRIQKAVTARISEYSGDNLQGSRFLRGQLATVEQIFPEIIQHTSIDNISTFGKIYRCNYS